jgi:hypothetical protein
MSKKQYKPKADNINKLKDYFFKLKNNENAQNIKSILTLCK